MMLRVLVVITIVLTGSAGAEVPETPPSGAFGSAVVESTHATVIADNAETAGAPRRGGRRTSPDPFELVSTERMLAALTDLTAFGAYTGWRVSASRAEAAALDWMASNLGALPFLDRLGLELERRSFHTFTGTEIHQCQLYLMVAGEEVEVPANGQFGRRDQLLRTLRVDSDGVLNDNDPDPVEVSGPVIVIRTAAEAAALDLTDVAGRVVFFDYGAIDSNLVDPAEAVALAAAVLDLNPAGVVLVTEFSNTVGDSFGTFLGDGSAFVRVDSSTPPVPTLHVRLEDMGAAGVSGWDDLLSITSARLVWDADVFAPGTSGSLIARIPGRDSSHAVILGGHIDSPNTPGALDDGSGSVVMLEVARVLDQARVQPPVDVYLCWFGSHERGLYGSYDFLATHQELLDRTLVMLESDCLGHPLDDLPAARITLETWPYGILGDVTPYFADYLRQAAADHGAQVEPFVYYGTVSDNSAFSSYDIPNADQVFSNPAQWSQIGDVHYLLHLHDPYDTVALARLESSAFEGMVRTALTVVLEVGADQPVLRITPAPDRRVVFVASHTESVHMAPTAFIELGMSLAWDGFDVDMIPYGQAVTAADLEGAAMVVALPVFDYPTADGDLTVYDEAWTASEIDVLERYVADGGFLVLTNSAHRLKYHNQVWDPNEDWSDVNALAGRFGVAYSNTTIDGTVCSTRGSHPLVAGVQALTVIDGNAIPFTSQGGQILARCGTSTAAALVGHGSGDVLALADLGIFGTIYYEPNLQFWRNLASYARSR